MSKPKVTIYTDGGADPNPGPGGWGVVLLYEKDGNTYTKELKGGEIETTNNRMELIAATEALRALKLPCEVNLFTDSQYVQQGISEWMVNWKRTNFKKGKIKNVDLWQFLDAETTKHEIHWNWVKGHASNKYNERADQLAAAGRAELLGLPNADQILTEAYHIYVNVVGAYGARPGIWAVLVERSGTQQALSGNEIQASPQRLYLYGLIAALEIIPNTENLHLHTGSGYLSDGVKGWLKGWKHNGWVTKDGSDVKHRDLWEQVDQLLGSRKVKLSSIEQDDPNMQLLSMNLEQLKTTL